MTKVLIAYFSSTGKTETMAQYIAEGVRFSGHEAVVRKMLEIKDVKGLSGYDGYIFGSPTFMVDLPKPVKTFLLLTQNAKLEGKISGAFGSYRHDVSYKHDAYAPAIIFNVLQKENKMKPFELGPFNLKEDSVETREGMKACQDYGRVFGEKLL
ncbi:MAG: flavodoxin domain-containing protein [Chloroflexi bacterium]|nr:flavodoxin domain-containing protein [Chloroflexota bacterium]